jgi:hypothetical protein
VRESLAEKYKRWRNRIDVGNKWLEHQSRDWNEYRDAYDGTILKPEQSDYKGNICSVNLQYVDVRGTIPKLYSQNPYIYIDPEVPSADIKAEVMERVVNAVKEKKWHLKKRVRDVIKATKLDGRAYFKTSYKFDKDKIGREYAGDEANDEISINVVLRKNLIIPRDCTSVQDAPWVAHKIRDQIGNIRSKFKLKKDEKISAIQDSYINDMDLPEEEVGDFQYGCYYEIEDRVERALSIIIDGLDRWAVAPYDFPYGYFSMYTPLEWNDIPGNNDTKADLHFWKRQLKQLAEEETMRVNHGRKLNAKYKWIGSDDPSPEQIKDIESYNDSQIIKLTPGQDIQPFQHATLGQEHYLGSQATRQDITIISGMNEMKQGLPQSKKTAREAMAIVSEAQDITTDRAVLVEEAVADVINKCIILIQQFYDTTRVVALTGMEQAQFLGLKDDLNKVRPGMLQGDHNKPYISFVGNQDLLGKMSVRTKAGSAMPVNEEQRKKDLIELFTAAASNQNIAASIDGKEALKEFTKALHLENKGIIIDPKSPEQESSLLKRNVPVMPGLNDNHDAHLKNHEMENNGTPAFIAHTLAHKLMKSFIGGSQLQTPQAAINAASGPGGLSQENIGGLPMGSSVPPGAMPRPGPAVSQPQINQPPPNSGLPI